MKNFNIYIISIFFLFLNLDFQAQTNQESETKPNIIFILTDDQRWDALGYAGNKLISTPEMDRLAEEGVYFENALVTTPICAASRATILTGLYERTHRFNFRTGNVRQEYMNLSYPKLLKSEGYSTGFYGKYGIRDDNEQLLFDDYEIYDRNNAYDDKRGYFYKTIGKDTVHLTRYTGQKAIDFIGNSSPNKPFCLSLSFSAPHAHDGAEDQYFWQEITDPLLQNTKMPDPKLSEDKYFMAQPKYVRDGFNRLRWTWRYDTPEKYQHSVKGYYRMISGIDIEIAKIRAKLEEKGIADNTVIILMGDNGYFMGERQLAGKWLMYDNSLRVPLIIYDPRSKNHQDIKDMALNVDIPSTIADFAGVSIPDSWQGKSLKPLVESNIKSIERDTVLIEHIWNFDRIPPSEGVRTDEWKYFRYVNDRSHEELYNLKKDPWEKIDLSDDQKYREVLDKMRNACQRLIKEKSDSYGAGPVDLAVEFIREPSAVKILDAKPEYSWVLPNGKEFQSGYQILVSSSLTRINLNDGDVWDSGEVRSENALGIEHSGQDLKTGQTYYWKVRIWDESNRLSDYSAPQTFRLGHPKNMITTENIIQVDSIKPSNMRKTDDDVLLLDFGKDAFASMVFEYDASQPHTLVFHLGEQLIGERLNREPAEKSHIRYQRIEVPVTTSKLNYTLPIRVDERNTLPDKAVALPDSIPVLMPFRYVEIENIQDKVEADNFTQLAYHSYWQDDTSSFSSSNDVLNQIWDLCKYTVKATTFAGLYVDGDRERIPYEADAYLNQLSHYTTDREYAIGRRTIEYFMEKPTWPTEWQQHVALMFYADYIYTGNTELIEKYYEDLKHKTLYELSNDDGLITSTKVDDAFMKKLGFKNYNKLLTDIVDWPSAGWGGDSKNLGERDGFVFQPYNTVVNAFFYRNMQIMAEFANILGKTEEAMDFELRALKAKKALNENMLDKDRGIYIDGIGTNHASLHANMLPLAFNMVPEENKAQVVEFIKSRRMACSVYGAQYLLDGLYHAGEADYALELLTDKSDRSWYNMIRVGSTMTLEAWDIKYKNNLDWNHAWGAVPANIIPRRMWGITPKTPGYEIAQIKPQLSNLKECEIKVPTLRGPIEAKFKYYNDRRETYTISIPGNMVAEFILEVSHGQIIMVNGEKSVPIFDSIRLKPGNHEIEVVVNSF